MLFIFIINTVSMSVHVPTSWRGVFTLSIQHHVNGFKKLKGV